MIGVHTQASYMLAFFAVYFAVDAVSVLYDAYVHRASTNTRAQLINGAVSLLAVAAALVAPVDIPALFKVFGAWAIATGGLAFVVSLHRRRTHGGQGVLLFSSAGAVLSGVTFIAFAARPNLPWFLVSYAVGGGLEFCVSALGLAKQARA